MENQQIWFVTGASKGLGLTLVKQLLHAGHKVAATSRNTDELINAVAHDDERFLALSMDLKSEESVYKTITKATDHFGQIDVVVNNAGHGLLGGLEELSDKEARDNFDVNVFGSLNVIRQVLPQLRKQQSGHILNISSIGGFTGMFPGFGIYCATKFAVQGFSESLAAEVKDFGIKVTVVSPGYFRTNFLTSDSLSVPSNAIDAYQAVRDSQAAHQKEINGNQPGNPEKAAMVMIKAAQSVNPPMHLVLGQDAYDLVYQKMDSVKKDMEEWKELGTGTGF